MKNIIIILSLIFFGFNSFAQDNEFAKMMREMYKAEFIDIVHENMNLTEVQNISFQPVFNEFMNELTGIMTKKIVTQKKFAQYFDGMTDEQANTIVAEIFTNNKAYDKLLKNYHKKVTKAVNAQSAFRFLLIVKKVTYTFDYNMIQNVPLVKN